MSNTKYQISAQDAAALYSLLVENGVDTWVDGGWGVDALLGKQTRPHGDIDLIIQVKDIAKTHDLLARQGYKIVLRDDYSETNFHMADEHSQEVDFTAILFDDEGNGVYGPPENNEMNPAASFLGMGVIAGTKVRCVAPEYAVRFRTGYELRKIDHLDVAALCDTFGLEYPTEYLPLHNRSV